MAQNHVQSAAPGFIDTQFLKLCTVAQQERDKDTFAAAIFDLRPLLQSLLTFPV